MQSIRTFFVNELKNWKLWEWLFLAISCLAIVVISFISGDTLLGVISSTTGVAYTVCNGKGKRIAYIFGLINSILYAYISFNSQIYGDAALYGLYYVPAMFVGFFAWKSKMDNTTFEVKKKVLNFKSKIALILICLTGTIILGIILKFFTDDALPFIDAFTTFASIVATILAIKRYNEQWFLWTCVNAVEVILWTIRAFQGAENSIISLVMWTIFLIIGIIMWIRWSNQIKKSKSI